VTTFDNGIAMINTESCAALGYDLAAVKQAFDGKCSSVLETTTQQNFN
jgi:putative ABC transport system substrate-binding protein